MKKEDQDKMMKLPYKPKGNAPYKPRENPPSVPKEGQDKMMKLPYIFKEKPEYNPKPDMRPYEEQQKDIISQGKKRAAEKAAQKERESEDAAMDRKMREASKKSKTTPLFNKGGMIKSKKMDGCCVRGKTRGRMC